MRNRFLYVGFVGRNVFANVRLHVVLLAAVQNAQTDLAVALVAVALQQAHNRDRAHALHGLAFLQWASIHTTGSHLLSGIGESSKMVPTSIEKWSRSGESSI